MKMKKIGVACAIVSVCLGVTSCGLLDAPKQKVSTSKEQSKDKQKETSGEREERGERTSNNEYNESSRSYDSYESSNYGTNEYDYTNSHESTYGREPQQFRNADAVMIYLLGRNFTNQNGTVTVCVRSEGIYANGTCLTGAVQVVEFGGTQAVVTAHSPYGTKITFLVDTEYNCIADNDDVYYAN